MKFCADCRFYEPMDAHPQRCGAPQVPDVALMVLGKKEPRAMLDCLITRSVDSLCGPDAKWWKAKE